MTQSYLVSNTVHVDRPEVANDLSQGPPLLCHVLALRLDAWMGPYDSIDVVFLRFVSKSVSAWV